MLRLLLLPGTFRRDLEIAATKPGLQSLLSRVVERGNMRELENVRVNIRGRAFRLAPRDGPLPDASTRLTDSTYVARKASVPRRVLVIEDNLDSMHALVFLLRDMGHDVECAVNGYIALEIAPKMRPEFVFLDLGLPGLDGFYVCERIRANPLLKATRVIAITAYGSDEHRARSLAAGCEQHLVKPVNPLIIEKLLGS